MELKVDTPRPEIRGFLVRDDKHIPIKVYMDGDFVNVVIPESYQGSYMHLIRFESEEGK